VNPGTSTSHGNLSSLDGLRGMACLMVLFNHYSEIPFFDSIDSGKSGVALFFTLSGFLMAYHYMPGIPSIRYWGAFFVRRFFRIYPAFFITLLALGLVHGISGFAARMFTWNTVINHWLMLSSINRFWFVREEFSFYLLFPFIAVALLYLPVTSQKKLCVLLALWVAILVYSANITAISNNHSTCLSFFIGGIAAGLFQHLPASRHMLPQRLWNIVATVALCLTVMVAELFPPVASPDHILWHHTWFFSPVMALATLSLAYATGITQRLFSCRASRFIGHISFSLYLIFGNVFYAGKYYLHTDLPSLNIFISALIAVMVSCGLYMAIERPFNRLGRKISMAIMR